jgi:hypothetical protein
MALAVAILAIAVFLAGAVVGFLALIIIGIRRGDRTRRLADPPRTQMESVTRRVLGVGTRNHLDDHAGEGV